MANYDLASAGDKFERLYWSKFLVSEFPAYGKFWSKFVVPLSNRPRNIHFKLDMQLRAESRTDNDICIAQLHYSVLRHLARVFEVKKRTRFDLDDLTEGMVRLVGAQDVAFELLERYCNPNEYDPWLETGQRGKLGGREARKSWQKEDNKLLQDIRNYRNHLVHGRLTPGVLNAHYYVPRIGREQNYFDWRTITFGYQWQEQIGIDLVPAYDVLRDSWNQTISYLQFRWTSTLL